MSDISVRALTSSTTFYIYTHIFITLHTQQETNGNGAQLERGRERVSEKEMRF